MSNPENEGDSRGGAVNVTVETLSPGDTESAHLHVGAAWAEKCDHDWVLLEHNRRYDQEMASLWYCRRCRRIDLMTTVGAKSVLPEVGKAG